MISTSNSRKGAVQAQRAAVPVSEPGDIKYTQKEMKKTLRTRAVKDQAVLHSNWRYATGCFCPVEQTKAGGPGSTLFTAFTAAFKGTSQEGRLILHD